MEDVDMVDAPACAPVEQVGEGGMADAEEMLEVTVGQDGLANFFSVSSALSSQPPGTRFRIIVSGGVYDEGVLDMREGVHIAAREGCGPASENPVVLTARADHPAFCSRVDGAKVSGVRIQHQGPFGSMACVVVEAGNILLEDCVVTGSVSIGVLICGCSTPTLRACQVQGCCGDGIKIADAANPTISNSIVHNNDGFGIFCTGSSSGTFTNNDIYANSNAGVAARGTCSGMFQGNLVHDGKQGGFWLEEKAKCDLIANDIYMNQKSGIQVGGHSNPTVMKNIVRDGLKGGIVVHDQASGSFLQNEILRNTMAGVGGTDSACPLFHSNIITDGKGGGIVLHENCGGVFEKNQVIRNSHAGIGLKGNSNALFDGNLISDGSGYGVWVQETAMSTLQNNVIERNVRAGVVVTDTASPTLSQNIIRDGKHAGLLIRHNAKGKFRQNTLSHNVHGNIVLLEQVSSELVANVISHGPLGGIIIRGSSTVTVRGNTICHNDGANIAVLDNSDPICDGNVLTNGAGRGLVVMDKARGTYRFNMIRNSELAGVYVGRNSCPELIANCISDGKAAGILLEDDATGIFTHNIVCANLNEGVAVHGRARPTMECNVVLQGGHGGIWLDENAGGTFRGNVVEDSGSNAYRCGTTTANEWRLAERNTNTAPAALAESLVEWADEKLRAPGGNKKVVLVQNPDSSTAERGVAMATQCSELLGLDPARSCMVVARFLGDAGQFEDAEDLIKRTRGFLDDSGPFHMGTATRRQQWGDMSLHCAELLNKWAASSSEYSKDLMIRAAEYARDAAGVFASIQPQDASTVDSFASSLYWCALNFATLCRLGGGGQWTADTACEAAVEAVEVAHGMLTENTPPHRIAELLFVQGVLSFCRAQSIAAGHQEDKVMESGQTLQKELLIDSLRLFETAYQHWCEAYGEKSLQTVKAITMIGVLQKELNGEEAGLEWNRKELRIREELQGEVHPRTQQARRTFTSMIDNKLSKQTRQSSAEDVSSAEVANYLEESKDFEDADMGLRKPDAMATLTCPKSKNTPEYIRWGQVSLYCAELLNKWAASSNEYSKDIMVRAAEHSVNAVEVFSNQTTQDQEYTNKYCSGLYWMGLNFATLCRLGGGGKWTTQQAYDIANSSLSDCERLRQTAADETRAEVIFAQGVLCFCKAEAVIAGYLRSTKMDKEQLVERKFMQALQLFEQSNQLWTAVYGEKHLETVKAITMIGTLLHRLQGAQAGMEWFRKELKIREELQGEMHPRTQQARRMFTSLLDTKLQAERKDQADGQQEDGQRAASSGSTTADAHMSIDDAKPAHGS